jgi:hypothetical protein
MGHAYYEISTSCSGVAKVNLVVSFNCNYYCFWMRWRGALHCPDQPIRWYKATAIGFRVQRGREPV